MGDYCDFVGGLEQEIKFKEQTLPNNDKKNTIWDK